MRYWLILLILILVIGKEQPYAAPFSKKLKSDSIPTKKDTATKLILIADIQIKGNKRTKSGIILRELAIKKGDILAESTLIQQIEKSRNQVINTALFIDVNIATEKKLDDIVTLIVEVKERWYLFPLPYFKLIDRNFNQWWVDENRSLDRVNYGIKFTQYNLSGNNDELDVWLINGYSKQINLRYNLPFFEKSLKHGLNIGFLNSEQKELNYTTIQNKQQFIKTEDFAKKSSRAEIAYSYRPDQYWRHYLRVGFAKEWISDSVKQYNPYYYPNQLTDIQFLDFSYSIRYSKLNYFAFPTKGFTFDASIYKRGLDKTTNLWQGAISAFYAKPLLKNRFLWLSAAATIKRPANNYYINQRLFGYGDFFLRGLEYYVIDGDAGFVAKATVHQQLFKYIFHTHLNSKNYNTIPFKYYLKLYSDIGYARNHYASVNNTNNELLSNKLIYTSGIGIDVVSIYDFVFRFEFSFNQLGGKGLFLHTK